MQNYRSLTHVMVGLFKIFPYYYVYTEYISLLKKKIGACKVRQSLTCAHIQKIINQARHKDEEQLRAGYLDILDHSPLKHNALLRQTAGPLVALLLGILRALSTRCRLGSRLGSSLLLSRFGVGLAAAMQSREADLGDVVVERLALDLSNLQLKRSGLTRAIGTLITAC